MEKSEDMEGSESDEEFKNVEMTFLSGNEVGWIPSAMNQINKFSIGEIGLKNPLASCMKSKSEIIPIDSGQSLKNLKEII